MLINSYIKDLDRRRVSIRGKSSTEGSQEGRYAVGKFKAAVSTKTGTEDRRCNIAAELERRNITSKMRAVDETKSRKLRSLNGICEWIPPHVRCTFHKGTDKGLLNREQLRSRKELAKTV